MARVIGRSLAVKKKPAPRKPRGKKEVTVRGQADRTEEKAQSC